LWVRVPPEMKANFGSNAWIISISAYLVAPFLPSKAYPSISKAILR